MSFHLIVRHPFGDYSRGDRITDPQDVARLLQDCGEHVTRVAAEAAEQPAADSGGG